MPPYWATVIPYRMGRVAASWYVGRRHKYRLVVIGAHNVPSHGGVLVVANHLRAIDSVALGLATSRQISFLAKNEYFSERSLKGRIVSLLFRAIGQVSIDRSGGKARPALDEAVSLIQRGKVVGVHGEGTR